MPQSQTVWSGHPEQVEEPDAEVCALGRSQHSWSGHDGVPRTGALGNHDPNPAGREPWSNQGVEQHQDGESGDLQVGFGFQQLLELQDLSESKSQTSCPVDKTLCVPGGHQGLHVSASLGSCEAVPVILTGLQGMSGFENGDMVGTESKAGPGRRVESGDRAETEAAAAAGCADFEPKVWAVLMLSAVLAEV